VRARPRRRRRRPAPILLKLRSASGHSGGMTFSAKVRERAEIYGFLFKVLDVKPPT
jgi:protease II